MRHKLQELIPSESPLATVIHQSLIYHSYLSYLYYPWHPWIHSGLFALESGTKKWRGWKLLTYSKQIHWNYTKFTSEIMKISMEIFSLVQHILKSADKHPSHGDEDMCLENRFSNSLQNLRSKYEGMERMECLVQLKHRDSRNTNGSAQDAMQLQRYQIQRQ